MPHGENWLESPPSWCPDAKPTKNGWVDKETGELLVCIKGLKITKEKKVKEESKKKTVKRKRKTNNKPLYSPTLNGTKKFARPQSKRWKELKEQGFLTEFQFKKATKGRTNGNT